MTYVTNFAKKKNLANLREIKRSRVSILDGNITNLYLNRRAFILV